MNLELSVAKILEELHRAKEKHPSWPDDPFIGLSIISEELGEAHQALLDARFRRMGVDAIKKEVIQVGAMAIRFLENFDPNSVRQEMVQKINEKEKRK